MNDYSRRVRTETGICPCVVTRENELKQTNVLRRVQTNATLCDGLAQMGNNTT